jgi:DNA-directed RNA polymerase specialized sigma24 family protein
MRCKKDSSRPTRAGRVFDVMTIQRRGFDAWPSTGTQTHEDRFEQSAPVDGQVSWEAHYEVDAVDVLGRISPRQRSVAVLFYLEDLSTSEIASSLGISVGAVKFHLSKARTALRTIFEEEGGPHE